MPEKCPDCKRWASQKVMFCATCGRNLSDYEERKEHPLFHLLTLLAVLAVVSVVIINLYYCITNFNQICEDCQNIKFNVCISLGTVDLSLFHYQGTGTRVALVLILIVEALCLAFGLYRFLPILKKEWDTGEEGPTENTGLSAASAYLCVSLFLSIAYFLIMGMSGNNPDTSWMNNYNDNQMAFMLARAGVREELMYRVFWIGLPMLVVTLLMNRDKRCWQYLFGGFGLTKVAFVLIILSSIMFGLGHYEGWGWVKVIDAAMGGIIFGYLYVEYGLYAAILAHTANDVASTVGLTFFGSGSVILINLSLIGLGLLILIYWCVKPRLELVRVDKMKTLPDKLDCNLLEQWKRH